MCFDFSTLETVRNKDDRVMLSQVLSARKYLNTTYLANAIELKNCLICCYDSEKAGYEDEYGNQQYYGFKIMGPKGDAEAETARSIEVTKAQYTLIDNQKDAKKKADDALTVANSTGNQELITAATNVVTATQNVLDAQAELDSAIETGNAEAIEIAQDNLITKQKTAKTTADATKTLADSAGNDDFFDAATDAYDATNQVVKSQNTIDFINELPDTIKLAKANDIRLYEAQVNSADDVDELMSYGIVGAQMKVVPDIANSNTTLPLWEGGSY